MKYSTMAGVGMSLYSFYQLTRLPQSGEMNESSDLLHLLGDLSLSAFKGFCVKIAIDVVEIAAVSALVILEIYQSRQNMLSKLKHAHREMHTMNEKLTTTRGRDEDMAHQEEQSMKFN